MQIPHTENRGKTRARELADMQDEAAREKLLSKIKKTIAKLRKLQEPPLANQIPFLKKPHTS